MTAITPFALLLTMVISMFLGAFFMAIIQHNKEKSDNERRIAKIHAALSRLNYPEDARIAVIEMFLWKGHVKGIPPAYTT